MSAQPAQFAPGEDLTLTQRNVLRAARASGRLMRRANYGVHALDLHGMPLDYSFPLRTVNALERSGYLRREGRQWALTEIGRAVAEAA
jgi:hypothetical protein